MGYVALHHWSLDSWRHGQWEQLEDGMKAGGHVEGLVTKVATDFSGLDWENEHEFREDGAMYDVLSLKLLSDGRWELRCIADAHESRMKADFETMLLGHEQGNAASSRPLVQRLLAANYIDLPAMSLHAFALPIQTIRTQDWALSPQASFAPEGQPPQQRSA